MFFLVVCPGICNGVIGSLRLGRYFGAFSWRLCLAALCPRVCKRAMRDLELCGYFSG